MVKVIKLTDEHARTRNAQWGVWVTHSLPTVSNPRLGTNDVFHVYPTIPVALLMNPAIQNPIVWLAETPEVVVSSLGGNLGCSSLTTIEKLPLPEWYTDAKIRLRTQVRFAILCAKAVLPIFEASFVRDYRPRKAIEAAEALLENLSATTDVLVAVHDAVDAATNADVAADIADDIADAGVSYAARSAVYAARSAVYAARVTVYPDRAAIYSAVGGAAVAAADYAVAVATISGIPFDINALAQQAVLMTNE